MNRKHVNGSHLVVVVVVTWRGNYHIITANYSVPTKLRVPHVTVRHRPMDGRSAAIRTCCPKPLEPDRDHIGEGDQCRRAKMPCVGNNCHHEVHIIVGAAGASKKYFHDYWLRHMPPHYADSEIATSLPIRTFSPKYVRYSSPGRRSRHSPHLVLPSRLRQ